MPTTKDMSLSERRADDDPTTATPPPWPGHVTTAPGPVGATYPSPYPRPWGTFDAPAQPTEPTEPADAAADGPAGSGDGRPSKVAIATCLGVGTTLFAVGAILLAVVL